MRLWLTCWLPCLSWEAARPIDFVLLLDPPPGVSTAGPRRWPAFSSSECHHGHGRHRGAEKLKLVTEQQSKIQKQLDQVGKADFNLATRNLGRRVAQVGNLPADLPNLPVLGPEAAEGAH